MIQRGRELEISSIQERGQSPPIMPPEEFHMQNTNANLTGTSREEAVEWTKQKARNFNSLGFCFLQKKQKASSATDSPLCDLGQVASPLCASVSSSAKWGQYVIYLPQRGGMRVKKMKLQIFILGCQEGTTSEPLNCWDVWKSTNNPFTTWLEVY